MSFCFLKWISVFEMDNKSFVDELVHVFTELKEKEWKGKDNNIKLSKAENFRIC